MKKPTTEIKNKMRELRPFVSFNYDLRKKTAPQSIAKVRKYYNELQRLKSYPTIKYYRPRARLRKTAAKKISILEPQFQKQFKVVPLADIPPEAKVKFRKGQLIGITEKVDTMQIPFNIARYLKDPAAYIKYINRRYPSFNKIRIKCGKNIVTGASTIETLQSDLEELMRSPKQKLLTKKARQEVFHSFLLYRTKGQVKNNEDLQEKFK